LNRGTCETEKRSDDSLPAVSDRSQCPPWQFRLAWRGARLSVVSRAGRQRCSLLPYRYVLFSSQRHRLSDGPGGRSGRRTAAEVLRKPGESARNLRSAARKSPATARGGGD